MIGDSGNNQRVTEPLIIYISNPLIDRIPNKGQTPGIAGQSFNNQSDIGNKLPPKNQDAVDQTPLVKLADKRKVRSIHSRSGLEQARSHHCPLTEK